MTEKLRDRLIWAVTIICSAAVLIGCFLMAAPARAATYTVEKNAHCIAHRGGQSTHTEETLPVYTEAVSGDIEEVEGDIRFTRTGFPVLLHDGDLRKFGAPGLLIEDLSVPAAKAEMSVSGDEIATLYELRTLLLTSPETRAQLELKTAMTGDRWSMLASRLAVLGDRVTLTSFSPAVVSQARTFGYRAGLLSSTATTENGLVAQKWTTVTKADVLRRSKAGGETQVWTPNTVDSWNTVYAAGVRTIITDKPRQCVAWAMGTLK